MELTNAEKDWRVKPMFHGSRCQVFLGVPLLPFASQGLALRSFSEEGSGYRTRSPKRGLRRTERSGLEAPFLEELKQLLYPSRKTANPGLDGLAMAR